MVLEDIFSHSSTSKPKLTLGMVGVGLTVFGAASIYSKEIPTNLTQSITHTCAQRKPRATNTTRRHLATRTHTSFTKEAQCTFPQTLVTGTYISEKRREERKERVEETKKSLIEWKNDVQQRQRERWARMWGQQQLPQPQPQQKQQELSQEQTGAQHLQPQQSQQLQQTQGQIHTQTTVQQDNKMHTVAGGVKDKWQHWKEQRAQRKADRNGGDSHTDSDNSNNHSGDSK